MLPYNKNLKHFSRNLRKNTTDAEGRIWSKIRKKNLKGYRFYRQKPILNYIVDFYCPKANLVIELDGGQHYSDQGMKLDKIRDINLKNCGIKVLRYSDLDVLNNIKDVIADIYKNLP